MKTTLVDLPVPPLSLPEWGADVQAAWGEQARRASTITSRAGTGRHFDALVAEARRLLVAGDQAGIVARRGDRRFVRAVLTAWGEEELARSTMRPALVNALATTGSFSRLGAMTAASLILEHFDLLDTWHLGLFAALAHLVRQAVAAQPARERKDVVESLRVNDAVMFVPDGPHRLAAWLVTQRLEPSAWLRAHALGAHADSRFGRVTRDAYFLAWIAAADAQHEAGSYLKTISDEVLARQRTESTDDDGRYFGHDVLEALTAKDTRHPSAAWLDAVLTIGGDPRTQATPQWRTWWARVSPASVQRAVRWMQGVNLKAFLDGVDAYARETGNVDMRRMLERRRTFLGGLYEQDRVDDVRLILGDNIRQWIARTSGVSIDAAGLTGSGMSDTAIVYMHCGDFSLVEGSHSFKLHLYVGGPVPAIADRRTRTFDAADLRERYGAIHRREYGARSYFSVAHQGAEWIRGSLDFLRQRGVRLDERALLTPNDYADLSRRRAGWY